MQRGARGGNRHAAISPILVRLAACVALTGILAAPAGTRPRVWAAGGATLEIRGRVCARATGAPVPAAQVGAAGTEVTADGSGGYHLTVAPAQHLYMRASALGFQSSDLITVSSKDGGILTGLAAFSFCGKLGLSGAFRAADGSVRLAVFDQVQSGRPHTLTVRGTTGTMLEANAALQTPGGGVALIPLRRQGSAIEATVAFAAPGRYVLEINAAPGFALIKLPIFAAGRYVPPAPPPPYQADPRGAGNSSLRAEALAGINALRGRAGLPPLQSDTRLGGAAQAHTDELVRSGRISHDGSNGSTPGQRVQASGVQYELVAEDIGEGATVQEVLLGLMDSPAHRWAILGDFRLVGIGIAHARSNLLLTADFVR